MDYLPDTNVWIEVLKGRNPYLVKKFVQVPDDLIASCSIVRAELTHGAKKYDRPEVRQAKVQSLLAPHHSLSFDDRCADKYGEIRHDLEVRGCVISPFDLQIAAIALVHDLTVVTHNTREFKRVTGLKVEDWSLPVE